MSMRHLRCWGLNRPVPQPSPYPALTRTIPPQTGRIAAIDAGSWPGRRIRLAADAVLRAAGRRLNAGRAWKLRKHCWLQKGSCPPAVRIGRWQLWHKASAAIMIFLLHQVQIDYQQHYTGKLIGTDDNGLSAIGQSGVNSPQPHAENQMGRLAPILSPLSRD